MKPIKTGRPELPEDDKQAKITAVRLRPDERELVESAAENNNQKLSDWMRTVLISTAKDQPLVRTPPPLVNNKLTMKPPFKVRTPTESQTLLPIRETEINGIQMGVLNDGTAYLSGRGLAAMCGIDEATVRRVSANWNSEQFTPRGMKIADTLNALKYGNRPLFHAIEVNGSKHHAYPDSVCMAFLEFYAFDTDLPKDQALKNYRILARSSLKAFIYLQVGYDPSNRIPECWRMFHDRVSLVHHKVPVGFFSVFKEMADLIVSLIQSNLPVDQKTVPDISVGITWGKYWTDNQLEKTCGKRIKFEHNYPDYFPQAKSNPQQPWAYPDAALPAFRKWMQNEYLPKKLRPYLESQEFRRSLPPSITTFAIAAIAPTSIAG